MSFLAPFYLAGLLAVGLPIVFHMIRRTPRGRMPFSTLMFLDPSPPRITSRSRVDNWLLLLLRALALSLLALAFMRPFLRQAADKLGLGQDGTRTAILIDTSASMRRGDLWKDAVARTQSTLEKATPADEIAILTFDRHLKTVLSFEEWMPLDHAVRTKVARERIAKLAPGWAATHLGDALASTCEALESAKNDRVVGRSRLAKRIIVIGDMQTGSRLESLHNFQWPEDVELIVERVSVPDTTNAGLQIVAETESDSAGAADQGPLVRVSNAADSQGEQFQIEWAAATSSNSRPSETIDFAKQYEGGIQKISYQPNAQQRTADSEATRRDNRDDQARPQSVNAYVPAGESRVLRAPPMPSTGGASRLVLKGDDHDFDNLVFIAAPTTQKLTVLYFGNDQANDPQQTRFYVERAFPETPRRHVKVIAQNADAPAIAPVIAHAGRDVHLLIATDKLPDAHVKSIRRYVHDGGMLVFVVQELADAESLEQIVEQPGIESYEADVDGYAMLTDIDFTHPIFASFSDVRFSDFSKIHVWKHRRIKFNKSAGLRVLARFDDGDPAVVEIPLGRGKLLLFTAGWHPEDNQLALSSKFVPLLNAILDYGIGHTEQAVSFIVGDRVPVARPIQSAGASASVELPDQTFLQLAAGTTEFDQTTVPGIYSVSTSNAAAVNTATDTVAANRQPARFTVNLDSSESKTSPLPIERLETFGVRLKRSDRVLSPKEADEQQRQLLSRELESRQKYWRWLIVAAIAVLMLETWLGGRMARAVSDVRE